jgi:hypothetical protein
LAVCAVGAIIGILVSRKVLFASGIIGLVHDWGIPPSAAQNVSFAQQIFDGWYTWGLGEPVVYPTEYPLRFLLGALASLGANGAVLSKLIVAGIPALAFVSAFYLSRQLRITPWAASVAGFFYAMNPVMLNKLVSGQSSYLFGYAVMPAVLATFLNARSKKHWLRVGIETGALLSLAAVEVQLGIFTYGLLVVAALCLSEVSARRRFAIVAVASICLLVIELPTIIGTLYGVSSLESLQIFRENLGWLAANSVHPLDALRLSGYLTNYDSMAVRGLYSWWNIAGFLVAASAIAGYISAPRWLAGFAAVCGAVTLLFVSGVYSFAAAPLTWLFVHFHVMQAFRELYHAMAILALLYSVGLAFFFEYARSSWPRFVAAVVTLVALGVYTSPMLTGNVSGWLQAFTYGDDMDKAYAVVSDQPQRTAWFPMDQPLAYEGVGAGVDPMFVSRPGSFWLYTLVWPFSAVDMAARAGRSSELQAALVQLSVGDVVERRRFASRLARFIPPKTDAMSAYLQEKMPALHLPDNEREQISPDTKITKIDGARPLAFSVARLAVVAPRLDALAFVPPDAEPVSFATTLPSQAPYVVITRQDNEADEALAALPQLQIGTVATPNRGFVPMQFWWWYRPEYAESPSGWLTMGKHVVAVPIASNFTNAALQVSVAASPVGGRLQVRYGGRRWIIDTNGPPDRVFSRVLNLGSVRAGSTLELITMDPYDDVALLSCRLIERSKYESMRGAYDAMLRHAQRVIVFRPGTEQSYVRVTYTAQKDAYLEVVGPDNYVVARRAVSRGRGTVTLAFDDPLRPISVRFRSRSARVLSWRLASAHVVSGGAPSQGEALMPGDWKPDGSASFERHLPIVVLNESFSANWNLSGSAVAHLQSIFGTNVYVTDEAAPVRLFRRDERPLQVAYVVGCILIALALISFRVESTSSANPAA